MISTKSKPTWRHSTWDGVDYMICTVIDPQKKLPVFKAGKWSLLDDDKIYLYGHDAKTMKHFTLYFASNDQSDTLDRSWFGEMWFPAQRHDYHVQSSIREECLVDPADLDLEYGCEEPCCLVRTHRQLRRCLSTPTWKEDIWQGLTVQPQRITHVKPQDQSFLTPVIEHVKSVECLKPRKVSL